MHSLSSPGHFLEQFFQELSLTATLESTQLDHLMELGKLYLDRCDFSLALSKFKQAADGYFAERNFDKYLKCENYMLRMHAEREDTESIRGSKERLQDLVLKEDFELNAKTYYTLGICASYKGQFDIALDYFQKSLTVALAAEDKPDICYAISGLAITYYSLDKLTEALKEIYNLQVFFQVLDLKEVKLSTQMLNGQILRKMGKHEQALEVLWDSYEILRSEKSLYMYLSLLYGMALTYREAGDIDMARMYLRLAKRSADPENLRYMTRHIDAQMAALGAIQPEDYDLVFDSSSHSVVERKKGRVDFKNQFILLDMLRLFMRRPGNVFSKEDLVQTVWKQTYDPAVHDNKIYVTIKRLRKMIEPDFDKPKYIFRAKNGYYLNKNTRVLLERAGERATFEGAYANNTN